MSKGGKPEVVEFDSDNSPFHSKKAQITIMIILGILLLMIISIFLFMNKEAAKDILLPALQVESTDTKAVRAFVETCIKDEVRDAVTGMGPQGGFLFVLRESMNVNGIDIPIVYADGKNFMITRKEMSDQLALYLDDAIKRCVDFTEFEQRGFSFEQQPVKTTVTISDFKITADVRFPITVIKADRTQELRKFLYDQPIALGDMRQSAFEIVQGIIADPDNIDFLALHELDYNVTFFPADEETIVYVLTETKGNDPLAFQFAARYVVDSAPRFEAPDRYRLIDGEPFFTDLQATDADGGIEGEDLVFTDDTAMFDILADGKILMVPEITGSKNVTITLTDPTGLSFSKKILFEVVE